MRSDNVTKGVERAPNRSLFYALGYTKEYGIAKMLNFAHGDVIMVGAYLSF